MLLLCVHSAVTHPNSHGQEEEGDRCLDVGTVGKDQLQASKETGCLLHIVLHCQKTRRQKASGQKKKKRKKCCLLHFALHCQRTEKQKASGQQQQQQQQTVAFFISSFTARRQGDKKLRVSKKTTTKNCCLIHIVLHCQKTERQKTSGQQKKI